MLLFETRFAHLPTGHLLSRVESNPFGSLLPFIDLLPDGTFRRVKQQILFENVIVLMVTDDIDASRKDRRAENVNFSTQRQCEKACLPRAAKSYGEQCFCQTKLLCFHIRTHLGDAMILTGPVVSWLFNSAHPLVSLREHPIWQPASHALQVLIDGKLVEQSQIWPNSDNVHRATVPVIVTAPNDFNPTS